ncbi:hypothetical protein AB9P05_14280 [Roseivirga sp. BDSF3-8]|uniref:hypothetical protein n=1 Tax=Roseivirga sp. BDSF3-8 TaxID=3241598 RepID=UPI0035319B9C
MKKLENINTFLLNNSPAKLTGGATSIGITLPTYMFVTTNEVLPDGTLQSDVQCIED